ncbi:uncharacterized protein K452DRAFT_309018 [Aplosporella prunicola CBS 121167]|uniref:GET complex subunit GET2 n=1 Tax=Aplosporella prunicola CBS 121167 TaxID=1176127 RepID=A0A6A6BCB7_9PEZI|nr:uncharacterized protein K452DRAFT_309018 [Aplosporella prunicola CBS 121167]KAF2141228.1 hypothetical protein K452DRAFT_309018 [Aplosporella prunicola CBS 121167]
MDETPTQRQARERRERRQAKIQAQGASRLEAITSLSGRPAPAPEEPNGACFLASQAPSKQQQAPPPNPPPAPVIAAAPPSDAHAHHPDPDEVDISEHYYQPAAAGGRTSLAPAYSNNGTPGRGLSPSPSPSPGPGAAGEDPMMRMLQQMMGGAGGPGDVGGSSGGSGADAQDPMMQLMAQMMGGAGAGGAGGFSGMPGMPDMQQQQQQPTSSAYVWRVVHAVFSFALAAYIALASTFNGSALSRSQSAFVGGGEGEGADGGIGPRLFWLFATFEVVLQSSRYFLEKGQLPPSGLLGTLGALIPEPYAGYVRLVGRYSTIYTTVVADAMVVVFVLGAMAWWKDLVVA